MCDHAQMDLRSIDLHLLACFDALMTDRSVTHASVRMNMSQPAMSNALARMRELFKDPLLVRTNKGMSPTARATELHGTVREALRALSAALSDPGETRLAEVSGRVTLAVTDYTSSILLPRLLPALRAQAPHVEVVVVPPDRTRMRAWLEEGEVDLTVGYFVELSEGLRAVELFSDTMCCIAASRHPVVAGSLDLPTYIAAAHGYWGGAASHHTTIEMMNDRALSALGLARRVAFRTTSAAVLAQMVAQTDLLGTIARAGAARYARVLPLQVLDLPFSVPAATVSMVWHERTHNSALMRWVRETVRNCAAWNDAEAQATSTMGVVPQGAAPQPLAH